MRVNANVVERVDPGARSANEGSVDDGLCPEAAGVRIASPRQQDWDTIDDRIAMAQTCRAASGHW